MFNNKNINNSNNRIRGAAEAAKTKLVPAISVDTLRGGRKRDTQYKCCVKDMFTFGKR